jgi:hypothetical protein
LGALALSARAESGRAARADRPLAFGLGLAVAFGVALSAWQLWVPNTHVHEATISSYSNRADALRGLPTIRPGSWTALNDFGDRSRPVVATTREFVFDPKNVVDDRLVRLASLPPGAQPFATDIVGGPYLVHVTGGVRVVGRTAGGNLVLQRTTGGSQPVRVELSTQLGTPVVLGRITTAASVAILLALAVTAAVRRTRRRSAVHPTGPRGRRASSAPRVGPPSR